MQTGKYENSAEEVTVEFIGDENTGQCLVKYCERLPEGFCTNVQCTGRYEVAGDTIKATDLNARITTVVYETDKEQCDAQDITMKIVSPGLIEFAFVDANAKKLRGPYQLALQASKK